MLLAVADRSTTKEYAACVTASCDDFECSHSDRDDDGRPRLGEDCRPFTRQASSIGCDNRSRPSRRRPRMKPPDSMIVTGSIGRQYRRSRSLDSHASPRRRAGTARRHAGPAGRRMRGRCRRARHRSWPDLHGHAQLGRAQLWRSRALASITDCQVITISGHLAQPSYLPGETEAHTTAYVQRDKISIQARLIGDQ